MQISERCRGPHEVDEVAGGEYNPHKSTKCIMTTTMKTTLNRPIIAIYLFAIALPILLLLTQSLVQGGLIRIYHKLKTPQAANNHTGGLLLAASGQSAQADEDTSRTSIEISSSPMRKIMDLIGQHAPVIVLDPSGDSQTPQPPPPPPPMPPVPQQLGSDMSVQNTLVGLPSVGGQQASGEHSQASMLIGSNPMAQQHHWTILDAAQLHQQQQHQQQPTAQQQQLIQSTVPNEQYFTFTPFGLAPTSNPSIQQDPSFVSPYQTQHFNSFANQQPQLSQQSSQNQQQMAQQQQQQQSTQNDIQPVFLSSYVPELPLPPGQQSVPQSYVPQSLPALAQQQPPNSIQQIQQAQAHEPPVTDKQQQHESGEADGPPPPSKRDSDSEAAQGQDEQPSGEPEGEDSSEGGSRERSHSSSSDPDEGGGGGEPGEGSMSYQNKYDSDRDEEPQSRRVYGKSSSSDNNQQVAAAAPRASSASPAADDGRGFASVGLTDDCLQCICRASSGCDDMLRCITIGATEKLCGPFQLTEEYWQRAGSPKNEPNSFSPFEDCANDMDCAATTVSQYMWRYKRNCDDDTDITCLDYARLHKLPPGECSQSDLLDSKEHQGYWGKFLHCADGYNRTRTADDENFKA